MNRKNDPHQLRLLTPAALLLIVALWVVKYGWVHHLLLFVVIVLATLAFFRSLRVDPKQKRAHRSK